MDGILGDDMENVQVWPSSYDNEVTRFSNTLPKVLLEATPHSRNHEENTPGLGFRTLLSSRIRHAKNISREND